jgi:formylglycine-generating enzyme required for sulfatase activity
MNELVISQILGFFYGIASGLWTDTILTSQKQKLAAQLRQQEQSQAAFDAVRPLSDDVRRACLELAAKYERIGSSPAEAGLRSLLGEAAFQADFGEWLQAGGIPEGDAVKARLLQKIETAMQATGVSASQLAFLRDEFFEALEKAVFADPLLANWRHKLSLQYLSQQVFELRRLNEEAAGIYSLERQTEALDFYCQKALAAWDIIDLNNLPEGDSHLATQTLLLRSLYMPLRLAFEPSQRQPSEDALVSKLEELRSVSRRIDAGHSTPMAPGQMGALGTPMAIGERLATSQRLVVLGDPGGGKTTMLRWLATVYLLRHKNDPAVDQIPDALTLPQRPWIPVLIRCRDLGPADLSRAFTDVLWMHLAKTELQPEEAKIMNTVILDRIAKGEILLLVDGLDEITDRQVRTLFCQQLERTAARYPEAPILVTSRIVGYREMPDRLRAGFEHGMISDLRPEDKDAFAKRWVEVTESRQSTVDKAKSAQELINALRSNDRIERMTGNPMLLTTLALVKRKVGKLPTRRNELYAEAVALLLNWNPSNYPPIDKKEALPQLGYLAYEMCRRGVQSLTGEELLDLLEQFRSDYPNIRAANNHNPQAFMELLEARSSLLMRAGDVWQAKQLQEESVWEFRHLTFQEYLAARALLEGRYKERDKKTSLAEQVALVAAPQPALLNFVLGHPDQEGIIDLSRESTVPDSLREALRLLVSDCSDDEVDAVSLSILQPGPAEDAAKTARPRAVLAAQCLAEEPNVSEDTAREVLQRLVAFIDNNAGQGDIQSNLETAALEVWHSSWQETLRTCLLEAFCDCSETTASTTASNVGGLLAQLLGDRLSGSAPDSADDSGAWIANLQSPNPDEAICAALQVVEAGYQGALTKPDDLADNLLLLLGRGGGQAHAAAWALAWLGVDQNTATQGPRRQGRNRLAPPLDSNYASRESATGWQPTAQHLETLLDALSAAGESASDLKRHLLSLLARTADQGADQQPPLLSPALLAALDHHLAAGLVRNDKQPEELRSDGLVVLALFGRETQVEEIYQDAGLPVALRRLATECLGLVASRSPAGQQRQRIEAFLETQLRGDRLDLLITGEAGWAEHDRRLPLPQGAARALQLAAAADLPLLGNGTGRLVPMLTLTALQKGEGLHLRSEVLEREVCKLPLPAGEQLELVGVPGGAYPIGSPQTEDDRDFYIAFYPNCEGVNFEAQRQLQLEEFAMARQAITQSQWRAVASLPRLERDLDPNPGGFAAKNLWEAHGQPGGLPVDSVSWHDCQEWLRRLNRWLQEQWPQLGGQGVPPLLALPGEGQWEVACRAGASTPFHFGDTLDTSWANFRGDFTYGAGRNGPNRQRPLPVGSFGLVNHWGLAELHGQLWEWCGDQWQPDPIGEGWPSDGRPWQGLVPIQEGSGRSPFKSARLLRGGSWGGISRNSRSAYRNGTHPDNRSSIIGFRVCCLPQHPSTSEPLEVIPTGAQEGSRPAPVISQRLGNN